jgi:hypothetical protein
MEGDPAPEDESESESVSPYEHTLVTL